MITIVTFQTCKVPPIMATMKHCTVAWSANIRECYGGNPIAGYCVCACVRVCVWVGGCSCACGWVGVRVRVGGCSCACRAHARACACTQRIVLIG